MHTLNNCQICNGNNFTQFETCKDYTVSKEEFSIVSCNNCGFKFTNPIPELSNLGNYYKSVDYISHSNSTKGLVNSLYQFVRKFTLVKKLQLIERLTKQSKSQSKYLLDVGCGTGEFLNACKNAGWHVQGVEPNTDVRNAAQKKYHLTVNDENYLESAFENSYDCITMWHVLEHVPHLNERILRLSKLLKPNGTLIVAVPNCSSYDAKHYGKFWGAYDVPRHLHHFTPKDIETLANNNSMVLDKVQPMLFDSFYVSLLSEKYKTGTTNILSGFWRGLISNLKAAVKNNNSYSSQIYLIRNK
jgi:ubiquinone/menaquinone biosynthesis C-methylase UbiE/transcription elongation factor Elf1